MRGRNRCKLDAFLTDDNSGLSDGATPASVK